MAPLRFCPTSLEHIVEFVKDTENDVSQMWIYDKDGQYLGSLLPTLKGLNISITEQQLTMVLYISDDDDDDDVLRKRRLIISDFNDYEFHYL